MYVKQREKKKVHVALKAEVCVRTDLVRSVTTDSTKQAVRSDQACCSDPAVLSRLAPSPCYSFFLFLAFFLSYQQAIIHNWPDSQISVPLTIQVGSIGGRRLPDWGRGNVKGSILLMSRRRKKISIMTVLPYHTFSLSHTHTRSLSMQALLPLSSASRSWLTSSLIPPFPPTHIHTYTQTQSASEAHWQMGRGVFGGFLWTNGTLV